MSLEFYRGSGVSQDQKAFMLVEGIRQQYIPGPDELKRWVGEGSRARSVYGVGEGQECWAEKFVPSCLNHLCYDFNLWLHHFLIHCYVLNIPNCFVCRILTMGLSFPTSIRGLHMQIFWKTRKSIYYFPGLKKIKKNKIDFPPLYCSVQFFFSLSTLSRKFFLIPNLQGIFF